MPPTTDASDLVFFAILILFLGIAIGIIAKWRFDRWMTGNKQGKSL